jgi:hypothetical protein
MKWADAPKSLQSPEYPEFGSSEPICPHCGVGLNRFPARRSKCPTCKTSIAVVTRELDGARVILRAADEAALQQQLLIKRLLRELGAEERQEYERICGQWFHERGKWPRNLEVLSQLRQQQEQCATTAGRHGVATTYRFKRAEVLLEAGRYEASVMMAMEVCYLDLCGVQDSRSGEPPAFRPWKRVAKKWVQSDPEYPQDRPITIPDLPVPGGILAHIAECAVQPPGLTPKLEEMARLAASRLGVNARGCIKPTVFASELRVALEPHLSRAAQYLDLDDD